MLNTKPKRRNKRPEAQMQEALIAWSTWIDVDPCDKSKGKIYDYLMSNNNGGKRDLLQAIAFKRMGGKAGVPDLFLYRRTMASYGLLSGLWLELKTKKGQLSEAQEKMIYLLRSAGYAVEIAYSLEEAKKAILNYLELTTSESN